MSESRYRQALQVAIGVMAALVLAFVLRGVLWPDRLGPRLPAASADTVWLLSHGALHQFSAQGQRLQSVPLAELPISDNASSLQFTTPDRFFVHDQNDVLRCQLARRQCEALSLPGLGTRRDYRWVRVSDDESEIVVSDASSHRIQVYQRDAGTGRYALARTYEGLRFPNQTLAVDGRLWVANTNRHEITVLDAADAQQPALAHHPIEHPGLRPSRQFPFAMQRDGAQGLWVLVANNGMRDADLLHLNREMKPDRVVTLAPEQDPNALLWTGGRLLATDMTRFQVYQVAGDGRVLAPFGDAAFQAELGVARAAFERSQRLPPLLIGAIAGLFLLCCVLGWKAGEFRTLGGTRWRPARAAADTAPPVEPKTAAPEKAWPRGAISSVQALPGATAKRRRVLMVLGVLHAGLLAAGTYWL